MIAPCESIHTFGMKGPIRVAFFDVGGKVLKVACLEPGRKMRCRGAEGVLEQRCEEDGWRDGWFAPGERLTIGEGRKGIQ